MKVYINGKFVDESEATVSIFDRCFLYGDGLFETVLIFKHCPFKLIEHLERLKRGIEFLKIPYSINFEEINCAAKELSQVNNMPKGMLRIQITRGTGLRGYSCKGAKNPSITMSIHPMPVINPEEPVQWRVITASPRIPVNNPLMNFKTCNKLTNILAKQEAELNGVDDALLLNTDNEVVSASSGNIFILNSDIVLTPPVESGVLPGITRATIFKLCKEMGIHYGESNLKLNQLYNVDGVFISMSSWGIIEVTKINNKDIRTSNLTKTLHKHYWELVNNECRQEQTDTQ
ncbi:MAG: aminotransferase class IV [Verrucomicrobiia bacterium]|jgi:aminodeoxychorismate lyase